MAGESGGMVRYRRPGRTYGRKLRASLPFTTLRFTRVDIWKDPDAFVRSVADGNETAPTVTVAGRPMVNPSRRRLLGAVREHAPEHLRSEP